MKAKKLMGMIACAGACVSLSAFGNTTTNWFAVAASGTDATLTNVSTNMGVEVTGGKLVIDTEKNNPLVFAPVSFATTNVSDGVVTITATAALTPNSTNDFGDVENAKVGLAVGVDGENVTNYYGYAAAGWKKLTGGASVTDDTTFTLVLDYRTHIAKFYIGATLMTYNDTMPTNAPAFATGTDMLSQIAAYGSGSISSIDTDLEVAVAAYNGTRYGSIAEASDAAKAASVPDPTAVVQVVNSDGTTEEANAKTANGLSKIVCEALGLDVTDPNANIAVAPVAIDTATDKITLQLTTPTTGTEANLVGYKVTPADPEVVYEAGSIQIPLAAGTYTITPVLK